MKTSLNVAKKHIPSLLAAKIVPFMHSSPGIGKSSVGHQIAKAYNLLFIDLRLSDRDPSDMNGLPQFVDNKAQFVPFSTFPLRGEELPEGYSGWLIMLDEFNSASHATQAAAYKLVLDRMVGEYHLHDKVVMIAAGNLEDDNAIVNPMSSALISRFAHFYIELNNDEWSEWAAKAKIDTRITSFLNFKTSQLYTFKSDVSTPYACPRTWEMVHKVIKNIPTITREHTVLLASLIGEGAAREFISFLQHYTNIPTYAEIVANPTTVKMDNNIGTQWAVMGMVCGNITEDTIDPACIYLQRMAMEMQVCALREVKGRNPELLGTAAFRKWRLALGSEIFVD